MRWVALASTILIVTSTTACERAREYELRGQVLAIAPERQEITVKHEDIRGFMPGMTMAFRVSDPGYLEGRAPGELIRATLVVRTRDVYLKDIEHAGQAPLSSAAGQPRPFDILEPGEEVPQFAFVDQQGRSHRLSEFRGRVLAVTFIYTRCPLPNFCPQMDRHFADVQRQIVNDQSLRSRVHLISVSFDPDFDRPRVLATHAEGAGANPSIWSFVTGDRDDVEQFAGRFGVSVIREGTTPQEIVHNLRTAVIDAEGRLVRIFDGNDWRPSELLTALRAVSASG